jgi:hypothetical protein
MAWSSQEMDKGTVVLIAIVHGKFLAQLNKTSK